MAQRQSGSASGPAYRHDFNADMQRTAQIEAVREHKKQENLKTSQYLAEQMKTTTVQGPARVKEYEDHIMSVNEKVADFFINNRDFMSDPGKFAEFKNITKQYIDNPIVERDIRAEKHHQMFQQAAASGDLKQSEIDAYSDKYSDYLNNEDADDFVFVRPKRIEMPEILTTLDGMFGTEQFNYRDPISGIETTIKRGSKEEALDATRILLEDEDIYMAVSPHYDQLGLEKRGISKVEWLAEWGVANKNASEMKNWSNSIYRNQGDGSENEGVNVFHTRMYPGIQSAMSSGKNYTSQTDRHLKYFTKNGDDGVMSISAAEDLYFAYQGDFITEENPAASDPNDVTPESERSSLSRKKLNFVESGGKAKIISASKLRVIGGIPYIEMDIELDINPKDTKLIEQLKANKFLKQSETIEKGESGGFSLSFSGKKPLTETYSGTVLQPANINEMSILKYNAEYNSQKGKDNLLRDPSTNLNISNQVAISNEIKQNPGKWTKDTNTGYYHHEDGIHVVPPDFSEIKVVNEE